MKCQWMRRGTTLSVTSSGNRSTTSFRISMGPEEVIELRRVQFNLYCVDVTPTLDVFKRWMAALSSADLGDEATVADTSSPQGFYDRNDLFVFTQETQTIITDANGLTPGHHDEMEFDPPVVLPRSPSLVLLNQLGTDAVLINAVVYYTKRKASRDEIVQLMKRYKSIKPATVPRVIDE